MRIWLCIVLLASCSYRERTKTVHAGELGSPGATITNYLSAPVRAGSPTEDTPSGVSREAVVDEARLDSLSPQGACITLTARTNVDLDMPLTDWNMKLGDR